MEELARDDPEAEAEVRAGEKTLRRARKEARAKKSARGDTGKSVRTPADAGAQDVGRSKGRPKNAVRSSSGEFRALTQAVDKADAALAGAEGKVSKVAGRLTGEARKKLRARLGKVRSRLDGLLNLVAGEEG